MEAIRLVKLHPRNDKPSPFIGLLKEFPWEAQYRRICQNNDSTRQMYAIYFFRKIVGGMVVDYKNEIPELVYFEIIKEDRGRGFGFKALNILFDILREKGFQKLFVQTGRPQIYENMGFFFSRSGDRGIIIDLNTPHDLHRSSRRKPAIVFHSKFIELHTKNPPELPERIKLFWEEFIESELADRFQILKPKPATTPDLTLVHPLSYLQELELASKKSIRLGPNNRTDPTTFELARLAYGAAMLAGEKIERWNRIFVLSRPPAHHAFPEESQGFCFLNHTAGLALRLKSMGYRPFVIDWDAHHGNGTEYILAPHKIGFASIYQKYLFPNNHEERIKGNSPCVWNFPVPPLCDDNYFKSTFLKLWEAIEEYKPDVLLISAGQDGHKEEKISGMLLSIESYEWATHESIKMASQFCEGRVIFVLEGGYIPYIQKKILMRIHEVLCAL